MKGITPPVSGDHWHPLIVMANPLSGGKDGQSILSSFRKLLNPVQVLDLSEMGPESGLEICRFLPDHTCRVLACGGDGTVGWILSAIDKADLPVSQLHSLSYNSHVPCSMSTDDILCFSVLLMWPSCPWALGMTWLGCWGGVRVMRVSLWRRS